MNRKSLSALSTRALFITFTAVLSIGTHTARAAQVVYGTPSAESRHSIVLSPIPKQSDLPEREEINKTFRIAPNAAVEVTGIAGPVQVLTTQGDKVEVNIVRTAQTRFELDCYRTAIRQTVSGLHISHEQYSSRAGCQSIRSEQRVKLTVPRSASLSLRYIAGDVNIGITEGLLRLDNITGHVVISGAEVVELNSLAQGLSLSVARVREGGIRVSGVVGDIELNFASGLNAEVSVSNMIGDVLIEGTKARLLGEGVTRRIRIGEGGASLSLSGIQGNVIIRHT